MPYFEQTLYAINFLARELLEEHLNLHMNALTTAWSCKKKKFPS